MGRDKKRKTHDSASSSTDNSATDTDDSDSQSSSEEQSTKREKSKSSKHKKSSKHHKHSSKRKDKRKKNKEDHEIISADDYFKKSAEFRSWLSNERGVYFSDLSSAKSRKLFSKFVCKWNSNQLKQSSSLEHSSQTKYKWKLADHDDIKMGSVRDHVSSWTSGRGSDGEEERFKSHKSVRGPDKPTAISRTRIGPERPPVDYLDPHLKEDTRQEERKLLQKSRKDYRKHNEMVMDELLPKATGHQARIEKKRVLNQQRREKDTSPDIDESSLMGSSDRIQDRIKSKHDNRERRAQIASQKISDYKEKEKSKVAAILEMARANKKEGSLW